jgi:hypothetical protein
MTQLLLPHAGHISEFARDPETGVVYTGTCTQTALEICLACVEDRAPTQDHMVQITRAMIAQGICTGNGAATLWAVAREARELGHAVALEWDYQEPLQGDWHKTLLDNAGIRPILMQVAVGMALVDAETGVRDEAQALHYHAIAIVGRQDDGYIVADGDHPQVNERFQVYAFATLQAAQPCGLLVLDLPTHPPAPALPEGWSDDGTRLIGPPAPDGVRYLFIGRMRQDALAYLAHGIMTPDDMALQAEHLVSPNRIEQTTNYHRLVLERADANAPWQPFLANLGASVLALEARLISVSAAR